MTEPDAIMVGVAATVLLMIFFIIYAMSKL